MNAERVLKPSVMRRPLCPRVLSTSVAGCCSGQKGRSALTAIAFSADTNSMGCAQEICSAAPLSLESQRPEALRPHLAAGLPFEVEAVALLSTAFDGVQ